jgi:hypothetical protein
LRSKDLEFWTRVWGRRDRNDEATRIRRKKAKTKHFLTEARERFEDAGWRPVSDAEIAEATELFQRIRAARRAGSDLPYHSKAEFASGIYALEMADAYRKCHTRRVEYGAPGVSAEDKTRKNSDGAWVKAEVEKDCDGGWAKAYGPIRQEQFVGIAHDEWDGFHIENPPPAAEISTEDRKLCARILAKSPGRKVGRPPDGERKMTDAERQQKRRAKLRLITATARPPGRTSNDRTDKAGGCHVNPKGMGGGNGAKSPRP